MLSATVIPYHEDKSLSLMKVYYYYYKQILLECHAFSGLGIVVYNVLLCQSEITRACSMLLYDNEVIKLVLGKGDCFAVA